MGGQQSNRFSSAHVIIRTMIHARARRCSMARRHAPCRRSRSRLWTANSRSRNRSPVVSALFRLEPPLDATETGGDNRRADKSEKPPIGAFWDKEETS